MSAQAAAATADTKTGMSSERIESVLLVGILVPIVGASMAAAFTHMHDWTMDLNPHASEWFGWANAVISELLMFAGFLLLRRRIRRGEGYWAPLSVMLGGTALSLCAQIHSVGWDAGLAAKLLAALPALAFMVLIKLIIGEVDAAKKAAAAAAAEKETQRAAQARQAQALAEAKAEIGAVRQALTEAENTAAAEAKLAAEAITEAESAYRVEAEKLAASEAKICAATAAHEAEIFARTSDADAAARELQAVRQTAAAHAEAARTARTEAEQCRRLADQATAAVSGLQAELAEARQAAADAHAHVCGYANAAGQAKDHAAAAVADAAAARAEAGRLGAELAEVRQSLARTQGEIHEYAERARRLRAEAEAARQATAQAEAHRDEIEAQARKWGALADSEMERLKAENGELRRAARAAGRTENAGAVRGEISPTNTRRRLASVPEIAALPAGVTVPQIEGVRPETVVAVTAAWHANRDATAPQLAEITGLSAPTVRKVLKVLNPTGEEASVLAIAAGQ